MQIPFIRRKADQVKEIKFSKIWIAKPKERRPRRQVEKPRSTIFFNKRRKFIVVSLLLSAGLFVIQTIPVESRYGAIALFGILSYLFSGWALFRDLRGIEWFSVLTLPTLYPIAVALFYFLLPQEISVRIFINILFAVSMYALLLTANIFAVASVRTIQLLRAARAVGFLLTILTCAFLYHVVFALRLPAVFVGVLVFAISFVIFYQGVWSHTLSLKGERKEMMYALVGSLVILEASAALSFWLLDVALASILLAMMMYVLLGLFQQDLEQRLFNRTLQEYLGFAGIVFLAVVFTVLNKWMN